jgi:hypothetical protein
VFVGKALWRSLYWIFFNFELFVTRYILQKTSLKLISLSISDFHLEMPFINQLNCKLDFLKYFSLISMIKSKNVTNITNAEYRSHLINTILNSKSLSKEIYNKLSPLEDLEVDSIKSISKWKSDMETDINFSDVFCNLYLVTNDSKLKQLTRLLSDSKTVLLQGKARYNEELSQRHFYKSYKGPNSLSQF